MRVEEMPSWLEGLSLPQLVELVDALVLELESRGLDGLAAVAADLSAQLQEQWSGRARSSGA